MPRAIRFPFFRERLTLYQLLSIIGIAVLFIVLRWNSFTTPFERDEGEYAYAAQLLRNNMMPYEHSFLQKPPMIVYIYFAGQLLSETSIVVPRVFASLSVLLTIALTGFVVARDWNKVTGIAAMALLTPLLSFPALFPFAANTEVFMILPMMVVFTLYKVYQGNASPVHWLLAGCSGAVALLLKPIAAPVLGLIAIFWIYETWKVKRNSSIIMRAVLFHFIGYITVTCISLAPFFLHDGGKTFRECVIDFNILYSGLEEYGIASFLSFTPLFWKYWWSICLLVVWFLIKRPAQWWVYLSLVLVSLATIYRMPIGHYYIMLLPFLAVIATLSLDSFFPQDTRQSRKKQSQGIKILAFTILTGALCLPNFELITKSPDELSITVYSKQNPFIEARIIGQKVQELTKPDDKIFIAGSEPEILYYANRKSISRFIIVYPLMIPTSKAEQYQYEAIATLEKELPELIVYVQSPTSWLSHKKSPLIFPPYIDRLVQTQYDVVGGTFFDIKQWKESPSAKELKRCSMVIYKKKV